MIRALGVSILCLLCIQTAKAQKADSVLMYMSDLNRIVDTKDSADHYLLIINPPDSSTGVNINHVEDTILTNNLNLLDPLL